MQTMYIPSYPHLAHSQSHVSCAQLSLHNFIRDNLSAYVATIPCISMLIAQSTNHSHQPFYSPPFVSHPVAVELHNGSVQLIAAAALLAGMY